MKKISVLLITSGMLTAYADLKMDTPRVPAGPSVIAKDSTKSVPETVKIRYIDPYKIVPNLEQWKDERNIVQADLDARAKQIEELRTLYTTKTNEIQSMGSMAKDKAKESAIEELRQLETSIQIKQQTFQEHAERAGQEAQMKIFKEIETVAKEYAQENNIDFIFAGGAIYVADAYDISDEIAQRMNKKYLAQRKTPAVTPKFELPKSAGPQLK